MNGIIPLSKPSGWTSFDAVAKLRGLLRARTGYKKIKIGHSGTLDPMATGVLPIFVGSATKAISYLPNYNKEYIAGFKLGVQTDTLDNTGSIISSENAAVSKEALEKIFPDFLGEISQIPPMFSAIKQDGKRLYDIARAGGEVERKPRVVRVHELELLEYDGVSEGVLRISCGGGTYVRSLIDDLARALGLCGGVMTSLARTRSNGYALEQCVSLEEIEASSEIILLPTDTIFSDFPSLTLDEKAIFRLKNGQAFCLTGSDILYKVYENSEKFIGLAKLENGKIKMERLFS